jgi:fatty acid amide hydrolase 2
MKDALGPRASALDMARAIRDGHLTSADAVERCIQAIDQVNPVINALVCDRYDAARREARAADEARQAGATMGPLHGVPCTIKESFRVVGMPNTTGLTRRIGIVSDDDAVTVTRLRQAGAIPVGVSNTSELCMWMESRNRVYGGTNNPYDPSRIVGGSSGGEGALVGSGASVFGLGADIGGSIRMPAFFNGVFGHKPSGGMVPSSGQHPPAHGKALRYLATGPLCRRAEDLMPLLRILAGPDGDDLGCKDFELGDPASVSLEGLRVLDVRTNGATHPSHDLAAAQGRVARYLRSRGARVERTQIPELKASFDIWSASMDAAAEHPFAELMGEGEAIGWPLELARYAAGRSQHTLMATLLAMGESVTSRFPAQRDKLVQRGEALKAHLHERLGDDGILLYPSYPTVAPRHRVPVLRQLALRFDYAYTAILNVMELAVTQVPLGLDRSGLPLGVQVGARPGNDHLTIAVAMALEEGFGGWTPPPVHRKQDFRKTR